MTTPENGYRCAHCEDVIDERIGVVTMDYHRPDQENGEAGFRRTLHFCSDLCVRPYIVQVTEHAWADFVDTRRRKAVLRQELGELMRKMREDIDRIIGGGETGHAAP